MAAREVFRIDIELANMVLAMDEEELRAFADLHEDPTSDEQTELYIFSLCILATRSRHGSKEIAQRAIQQAEGWAAVLPDDSHEKAQRLRILDSVMALTLQFE